jgi:hypothetical protein
MNTPKNPPQSPFIGAVAVFKISRSFLRTSLEMTDQNCHFDV